MDIPYTDNTPPPDAVKFIELLTNFPDSIMHFRTFHDKKDGKTPVLCYNGKLDHVRLAEKQKEGQGVFVCINNPDLDPGDQRTICGEDIKAIRAFWIDGDGIPMPEWHLKPTFICWRDDFHWHAYWVLDDGYHPARFSDAQLSVRPKTC